MDRCSQYPRHVNSINCDFGDDDYDAVLSTHSWDDTAQINMA